MKLMGEEPIHLVMGSSAIIANIGGVLDPWKSQLSTVLGL